jgi:hypothetical protein
LTTGHVVIGQQHRFNLADLRGRLAEPVENRIGLMARGAAHATDPIAFSEKG